MPELWLPKSARRKVYLCTVPGCDKRFGEDELRQFIRHTTACSNRNEDRILEANEARKASQFTSVSDTEQLTWKRQVHAGVRNPKSRGVIVDPVRPT